MSELQKFSILAGQTVMNTGPSIVAGGVGVSPGTAVAGFPPGKRGLGGNAQAAMVELQTAFMALSRAKMTADLTGKDLGGMRLEPGVYKFASSAELTGTLTLDGHGDPGARFVFLVGSTLTTASNSEVELDGVTDSGDVSWIVSSSATLGTHTAFAGNIMAQISVTLTTGASVNGAVYAIKGSVTLDDNDVG